MDQKKQLMWGLVAIALAIVFSSIIGASAIKAFKLAGDTISVTGSARMEVTSDFAKLQGNINFQSPTLQQGAKKLKQYRNQVQEFLTSKGIPESAISFGAMNNYAQEIRDDRGRSTGKISGYRISQEIIVRSEQVELIGKIAQEIDELVVQGVPYNSYGPEFMYTKLNEARIALMEDATIDAKKRAEKIAKAADGKVGAIRDARMGVIQVVAPNSTSISDYGMYDTSTIQKNVVAVVKVNFSVR